MLICFNVFFFVGLEEYNLIIPKFLMILLALNLKMIIVSHCKTA